MRLAIGQITFMKNLACFVAVLVYMSGGRVAAQTCSAPCDLTSEISQTTDVNSLQAPPAGIAGLTGGCGFGSVTATGGTCSVDATHKWGCTINSASSGHYTPTLTYIPGPVPEGCTYPDPATTTGSVYIDAEPPTVSVTSPQSGVWVRREDNLTGEAQDDMQLFNAGAVACKEPGCGSTGAFSFPSAAGVEDFHDNVYYNNEKLKNADWSVPIAGVVTCGKNPQTAIVQVRDSVFHLTEESISFNADCYPPQVSISEPPMYGNSWTDPQNPVIKGVASDDGTLKYVAVIIYDETSGRYWNGSDWQAALTHRLAELGSDGKWEYAGLKKEFLKSTNYKIVAVAKDVVDRTGEAQATVGYKKRINLGKKDFAGYAILVKEVKNIARAEDTYSFITHPGEDTIGVTAEISPYRLSPELSRYVKWDIPGMNSVSGNPFPTLSGNPAQFYTRIPPIPAYAWPNIRGGSIGYWVYPWLEYDYDGEIFRYYSQNYKSIFQDNLDVLRQEYVDFGASMKERGDFDQFRPPKYPRLLDFASGDIGFEHEWWIVKDLYPNAIKLDDAYLGDLNVTAGYRCPVGNRLAHGVRNSRHMRGKALDYNQGLDTESNCAVWAAAAKLNPRPVENFLYDTADNPTSAPDCSGGSDIDYTHGHVAWE